MTGHRKDKLKLAAYGLAVVVLLALAMGTRHARHEVDNFESVVDRVETLQEENAAYLAAGRESRIQFQARETFLLCSRDLVKTVTPERRAEVAEVCSGYETMADALRTEHAVQARVNP